MADPGIDIDESPRAPEQSGHFRKRAADEEPRSKIETHGDISHHVVFRATSEERNLDVSCMEASADFPEQLDAPGTIALVRLIRIGATMKQNDRPPVR